jgi:hypothetical protein
VFVKMASYKNKILRYLERNKCELTRACSKCGSNVWFQYTNKDKSKADIFRCTVCVSAKGKRRKYNQSERPTAYLKSNVNMKGTETMNVKKLSLRELDALNARTVDALVKECLSVQKQRVRMRSLSDLLFSVQIERQLRIEDPWANEDTCVDLTDADLAIAYAAASET